LIQNKKIKSKFLDIEDFVPRKRCIVLRAWAMDCRGPYRILSVDKNSGPKAVSGPKFMKFWDNVGNPLYFPTPLPDCLLHVSFRR